MFLDASRKPHLPRWRRWWVRAWRRSSDVPSSTTSWRRLSPRWSASAAASSTDQTKAARAFPVWSCDRPGRTTDAKHRCSFVLDVWPGTLNTDGCSSKVGCRQFIGWKRSPKSDPHYAYVHDSSVRGVCIRYYLAPYNKWPGVACIGLENGSS